MDINPVSWLLFPFLALTSLIYALGGGQQVKSVSPINGIEYYQSQPPVYQQNQQNGLDLPLLDLPL